MVYCLAMEGRPTPPRIRESAVECKIGAQLILWTTGIDVLVPKQDAARHGLDVLEPLLAEDLGELHRAPPAAAVDDHLVVRVRLDLGEGLADLLQRDQLGAL